MGHRVVTDKTSLIWITILGEHVLPLESGWANYPATFGARIRVKTKSGGQLVTFLDYTLDMKLLLAMQSQGECKKQL